MKAWMGAIPI